MVHLLKHLRILVAGIVLISAAFSAAMVDRARAQDAPAEETGVPLADYVSALREAQDILSHGGQPSAVDQARAALAGIDRIELAGGAEITVAPLLGVEGAALTQDAAAARVGILLAQLDAAGSDNTSGRLAVLDQVLARPAFQQGESWWEVFRRWLAEWLARLLPDAAPSSSNAGAAGRANELIIWSIGIVGIAAIVLLLAYWLRGLIAGVVANADGDEAGGNEDDLPQSPAEARQRRRGRRTQVTIAAPCATSTWPPCSRSNSRGWCRPTAASRTARSWAASGARIRCGRICSRWWKPLTTYGMGCTNPMRGPTRRILMRSTSWR